MIPTKKVEQLVDKHRSLEKELSSGDFEKKDFAIKSKEYSSLGEIIQCAQDYLNFENQKKELDKIINEQNIDKEMKELAQKELKQLIEAKQKNEQTLKLYLLPKDEADKKNVILEIRAGTGGLEASLFAADLYKMYEKVCHKKKWNMEIISISKSDAGGLKEAIISIVGNNIVYLSVISHHKVESKNIISHIVKLVEEKSAELERK